MTLTRRELFLFGTFLWSLLKKCVVRTEKTMKNDKYVLQMENKVWYLEWVNESLKKKIKQLDPNDTLSDWDWKTNTPHVGEKMKADQRSFKESMKEENQ